MHVPEVAFSRMTGLTSFIYIYKKIYQYFSSHSNGLRLFPLQCVEGLVIK